MLTEEKPPQNALRLRHWLLLTAVIILSGVLLLVLGLWLSGSAKDTMTPPAESFLVISDPAAGSTATRTPFQPATFTPTLANSPSPTPTPTITPTVVPTEDGWIIDQLSQMTIRQKVGQMILVGVSGMQPNQGDCGLIGRLQPGGILLIDSNVSTPQQLRLFSGSLQDCSESAGAPPLLMALDHEGQYTSRFESGSTVFPAAMAIGATEDTDLAHQAAYASGLELAYSGINLVLGPVADVLVHPDNTVIALRAFSSSPDVAAALAAASVEGYLQTGVIPVLKHYPGHGGTAEDSHLGLPIDPADRTLIETTYLPPFTAGLSAGAPVVMTAHVAFSELDTSGLPMTLSEPGLALLRDPLAFEGLILTDSLEMGAITNQMSVADAALQAVKAGVDFMMLPSQGQAEAAATRLETAIETGELTEGRLDASVSRILTLKAAHHLTSYPQPLADEPDWQAHEALAYDAGYRAVTLLRDDASLVPLPDERQRVLVIGPADSWGLYLAMQTALEGRGFVLEVVTYSSPWAGRVPERGYIDSLPARAAGYDLVVALTWNAHVNRFRFGDDFQPLLVNNLLKTDVPVVVVALRTPTDLLEFPNAPTYLTTCGTTPGQVQALADILAGAAQPAGSNPLPGIIP
jgi:beta-N-acetylhexosaminidase